MQAPLFTAAAADIGTERFKKLDQIISCRRCVLTGAGVGEYGPHAIIEGFQSKSVICGQGQLNQGDV